MQNPKLQEYRDRVEEIVRQLHDLTLSIGHEELGEMISELRQRIREPFLFVIVGEVKAGKSSFVNALLDTGRDICKVAPQPMTDTIQQIVWGPEERIVEVNPYLKKIYLPEPILQEFAIVDTPGTNTIIEHHQEITERFIPAADLVVFVFEAKNPYRQSAWQLLDHIRDDWRKKVIFVLQQKDLLSDEELRVNLEGVRQHARRKGIEEPVVFAVSAKWEQEGRKEDSGFGEVRRWIAQHITGGKAPWLKLANNIELARQIALRIGKGLADRRRQYEADRAFRADVAETLDTHEGMAHKQARYLVERILAGYDRVTGEKERALASGLSVWGVLRRGLAGIFSKDAGLQPWLENLVHDLDQQLKLEMQQTLQDGIEDLALAIQEMARMVDLKIRNSQTILKADHDIFADIADRRAQIMGDLQQAFAKFLENPSSYVLTHLAGDRQRLGQDFVTGSGIAVIGAVIAAVAQGAVFDVTGGILTTVGLLFAGISTSLQRRRVLKQYRQAIAEGRSKLEAEVTRQLDEYIRGLRRRIERHFRAFDRMLEEEGAALEKLQQRYEEIVARLEALEQERRNAQTE